GNSALKHLQQLMRNGMRRNAQAHAVLTPGDEVLGQLRSLEDQGERAGPEAICKLPCGLGHLARPRKSFFFRTEVDDHRMVHGATLGRIKTRHGLGARRIGAEPVHRFGREGHESAGTEDLRGLADLGLHGLGSSVFQTASACFFLNSSSFEERFLSDKASMATAYSAALAAPASPMAKVATGTPFGICTVESSESRPCRCFEGIGTPSTGRVVCAATTPARWAAPPAPAMMAFRPRFAAHFAHSATRSGVRCADIAFA